ncbi:MAG TPA: hypothetical protein DDW91_06850 [Shewanella frigidimarina]|nr:hypothetical protein [Shewanella frigidimarina]
MSNPTKRAAKTAITIWYKRSGGLGGYGSTETWDAITTLSDYKQGGSSQFASNGVTFNPQSQYWLEYDVEKPSLGDFVALGEQDAITNPSDANGAEELRMVNLLPADILRGNQLDDLHLVT